MHLEGVSRPSGNLQIKNYLKICGLDTWRRWHHYSTTDHWLKSESIRWPVFIQSLVTSNESRRIMNLTTYLKKQFANLNGVFHAIAGDLTEEEWLARPAPGQNTIGYTVWHIPRTQDNFLQTWIRGQAEIFHSDRWAGWHRLRPLGVGIGIMLDQSDEIARTVHLPDVLAYADQVHQTMTSWLGEISEEDLDSVLDAQGRLRAFPEYQTPGYLEEVDNLFGLPVWGLLIRPCMGHVHRHLGELEITKDILRKGR
jgi:DinB superfamily